MEDKKVKGKNIIKQLLHAGKLQQGQPHSHFSYHPPNPGTNKQYVSNNEGNYNWKKAETYDISTN